MNNSISTNSNSLKTFSEILCSSEFPREKFIILFLKIIVEHGFFCYDTSTFEKFNTVMSSILFQATRKNRDDFLKTQTKTDNGFFHYKINGEEYLFRECQFKNLFSKVLWNNMKKKWSDKEIPWCVERIIRIVNPIPGVPPVMKTFHTLFSLKHLRDYSAGIGKELKNQCIIPSNQDSIRYQMGTTILDPSLLCKHITNKYTISMALFVVCRHFDCDNDHRKLYMDVRKELEKERAISETTRIANDIRKVVMYVLKNFGDITKNYDWPLDLNVEWGSAFWWELLEFNSSPIRIYKNSPLSIKDISRKIDLKVVSIPYLFTPKKDMNKNELKWPTSLFSIKEALMTVEFWVSTLGLVPRDSVRIDFDYPNEQSVIFQIDDGDLLRLWRYSSCLLHFTNFYHFPVPMYPILCRNYLQSIEDGDYLGMKSVMTCIQSLVGDDVSLKRFQNSEIERIAKPEIVRYYGLLHGILARFGNGIYWESIIYPYRNLDECTIQVKRVQNSTPDMMCVESDSFEKPKGNQEDMEDSLANGYTSSGVIYGFKVSSDNFYTAMTAFISITEDHMIRVEAISELYTLFKTFPKLTIDYPLQMKIILYLQNYCMLGDSYLLKYDWGTYVRIPAQIDEPELQSSKIPIVCYLYSLILLQEITDIRAFRLFTSIRIVVDSRHHTSLRSYMPKMRKGGISNLVKLEKAPYLHYQAASEFDNNNSSFYSGEFTSLGMRPNGFELMAKVLFSLEMLSYLPSEKVPFQDAEAQVRQAQCIFTKTPPRPLESNSYRGVMSPWHFTRYRSECNFEKIALQKTPFYIGNNQTQDMFIPMLVYRKEKRMYDESRYSQETSLFFGSSPEVRDIVYSHPISVISETISEEEEFQKINMIMTQQMNRIDPRGKMKQNVHSYSK